MQEKTIRKRKKACDYGSIKKEIKKIKKTNQATTDKKINKLLKCVPNFLGCYAENEVTRITFNSFPCFLIVNVDSNSMPGSHWLALGIYTDRIEIFDPLGFKFANWSRIPCSLLKLLHRLSQHRRVYISKRIQSDQSILCAFYCIYYCIFRSVIPFSRICRPFNCLERNDHILIKLFS